ncbi:MAG: crosslink repair DNA glycosylase YcaQ family protein [Hyphomonadaceae bacterium]
MLGIIKQLGYVQLDTIQTVSRAHHHILWSRAQHYREPMLEKLLSTERAIFEHFTHDASVLPMEFYPAWRRQFTRLEAKVRKWEWHRNMLDAEGRNTLIERIRSEGPLSTAAFDTKVKNPKPKMWNRPPHKLALDYLWYAGELSTSHRQNFKKFYDLSERVIPADIRADIWSDETQIDWLIRSALSRLVFATPTEVKNFWGAMSAATVKAWMTDNTDSLIPVEVQAADKTWHKAWSLPDIETQLASAPKPTARLRILNPFDPLIRDRARLKRLFGFDYRIEIFVPAAKRQYGYYIYPLLEADRLIGRAEITSDRKAGALHFNKLWLKTGIEKTPARTAKLHAELGRFAKLVGAKSVFTDDALI